MRNNPDHIRFSNPNKATTLNLNSLSKFIISNRKGLLARRLAILGVPRLQKRNGPVGLPLSWLSG
ncbi:MAG: hypothetical protein BGO39_30995 [Chloroflexi bacterium 54-19]|nr:MAG: hypothetical protein BGO39_30995 [Chloroflexi bacterium 54-19]